MTERTEAVITDWKSKYAVDLKRTPLSLVQVPYDFVYFDRAGETVVHLLEMADPINTTLDEYRGKEQKEITEALLRNDVVICSGQVGAERMATLITGYKDDTGVLVDPAVTVLGNNGIVYAGREIKDEGDISKLLTLAGDDFKRRKSFATVVLPDQKYSPETLNAVIQLNQMGFKVIILPNTLENNREQISQSSFFAYEVKRKSSLRLHHIEVGVKPLNQRQFMEMAARISKMCINGKVSETRTWKVGVQELMLLLPSIPMSFSIAEAVLVNLANSQGKEIIGSSDLATVNWSHAVLEFLYKRQIDTIYKKNWVISPS